MSKNSTNYELGVKSLKSKSGIFVIDAERKITFWSQSAEKILGFSEAEVLNSRCYVSLCKFSGSNGICSENCHPVANSIRNRVSNEFEVTWANKKGKKGKYKVNTLFSKSGNSLRQLSTHKFDGLYSGL